ncbi:MAG: hypothetical protein LUD00_04045 [Prevotellaceae bacterium]|nr:hypothetical protein [Prevotellaceae bacterium]
MNQLFFNEFKQEPAIQSKDIKGLTEKIGNVDWKGKADEVILMIEPHSILSKK